MSLESAITQEGKIYKLKRELASGGQGTVYVCADEKNLVKICKNTTWWNLRNLVQEFRAMPEHIKQVFSVPKDIVAQGDKLGYVMPYQTKCILLKEAFANPVDGKQWEPWHIKRNLKNRLLISFHIAQALMDLHAYRYVYRDLSARNILIAQDAQNTFVRIIDVDNIGPVGREKRLLVTKPYSAPELMRSGGHSRNPAVLYHNYNTDNYSLAVILFKFLLGKSHPLIGDLISENDCEQEAAAYLGKGGYVLDDPKHVCISETGERQMKQLAEALLPYKLQQVFHKTFVEGLNEPMERSTALDFAEACFDGANQVYFCPHCHCGYILQVPKEIQPLGPNTNEHVNGPISIYPRCCPHCGEYVSRKVLVIGDMVYPKIAKSRPGDPPVSNIAKVKAHKWAGRQLRYIFPIQDEDIVLARKYIKPCGATEQFEDGMYLTVSKGKVYWNNQSAFRLYYAENQVVGGKERTVWKTVSGKEALAVNKNYYFEPYTNNYEFAERFIKIIEE